MDENNQKFELLKREVDALQVTVSERSKPWYLNVPTIISIIALIFSFSTTAISYIRINKQDVASARAELRQVLQRLVQLPKELSIDYETYSNRSQLLFALGQYANHENAFLVAQSEGIIDRIPRGMISAGEYYSIALAYQNAYELGKTKTYLDLALEKATHANDFIVQLAVLRTAAHLLFTTGTPSGGRSKYQEALEIFSRSSYASYDQFTKVSSNILTLLSWTNSEIQFGEPEEARRRVANAEKLLGNLPESPLKSSLYQQISSLKESLD